MARTTRGKIIKVTCDEWDSDEFVEMRSVKTTNDSQWINATATVGTVDPTAPNGVRMVVDSVLLMQATIAKMTTRWTLKGERADKFGNILYDETGKPMMDRIELPDDPNQRMKVIGERHEEDTQHIFVTYMEGLTPPPTKQEDEDFLPSANVPTSETSETGNLSLTK